MTGTTPTSRAQGAAAPLTATLTAALTGLLLLGLLALAGCADDGRTLRQPTAPLPPTTTVPPATLPDGQLAPTVPAVTVAPMRLVAPWPNGASIPVRYTCDDVDLAPALTWLAVPAGAVELALTMTDLDLGLTHWILTGISPTETGLVEGQMPIGASLRPNGFGTSDWVGPCPPPGDEPHRYMFTLHALNQQVEAADDAPAADVVALLNQTVVAQSSITGTYHRDA